MWNFRFLTSSPLLLLGTRRTCILTYWHNSAHFHLILKIFQTLSILVNKEQSNILLINTFSMWKTKNRWQTFQTSKANAINHGLILDWLFSILRRIGNNSAIYRFLWFYQRNLSYIWYKNIVIREVSLGLLSYTINFTSRIPKIRLPAKTIDKSNHIYRSWCTHSTNKGSDISNSAFKRAVKSQRLVDNYRQNIINKSWY